MQRRKVENGDPPFAELHSRMIGLIVPGVCFSAEILGWLEIKLRGKTGCYIVASPTSGCLTHSSSSAEGWSDFVPMAAWKT